MDQQNGEKGINRSRTVKEGKFNKLTKLNKSIMKMKEPKTLKKLK